MARPHRGSLDVTVRTDTRGVTRGSVLREGCLQIERWRWYSAR